jgi:hypothetical protein
MNQRQDQPRAYVYGVFAIPNYIVEAREVESIWTDEGAATDRARMRSIQVSGRVCVVRWQVDMTGSRTVLRAFRDGKPVSKGTAIVSGTDLLDWP